MIRSREIYVSIILQSLSQLRSIYGESRSMTIINNCDNCLYLGGQDVETAKYIALKANKTPNTILNLPLGSAYLFTRGALPGSLKTGSKTLFRPGPGARGERCFFLCPDKRKRLSKN